jgi:hypothetical protein
MALFQTYRGAAGRQNNRIPSAQVPFQSLFDFGFNGTYLQDAMKITRRFLSRIITLTTF